uniref:Uncharacterized protein n=1 Tax=Arundo donax TaxID=35708 RepID=A0A0A9C3M6_ARUDO
MPPSVPKPQQFHSRNGSINTSAEASAAEVCTAALWP